MLTSHRGGVMGPTTDEKKAKRAYEEILALLKTRYRIQYHEAHKISLPDCQREREERNEKLEQAVRSLFELDAWENF